MLLVVITYDIKNKDSKESIVVFLSLDLFLILHGLVLL